MFDLKTGLFSISSRNVTTNSVITLFAVGDIVLDLNVKRIIKHFGPDFPFEKISGLLKKADLVFGNLESPLSNRKIKPSIKKRISFCGTPEGVKGLKHAGFNILNIANNHIMDFGKEVMTDTIHILKKYNIGYIGAGNSLDEARKPFIINIKDTSVGFLGYTSLDPETNATQTKPGTAPSKIEFMLDDVSRLKKKVDIVIVSIHRGLEFVYYPLPEHQKECRKLIEKGANIILCHHPHVPQGIEIYKNGLIAYSLGEFISDFEPPYTEYENALFLRTRKEGFFLKIRFDKKGIIDGQIIPRHLNDKFQAYLPEMKEREILLHLIYNLSKQLKDNILDRIFWKNSKNHLILRFSAAILNSNNRNLKGLVTFFRWITSDLAFKMILGNVFKIYPSAFLVSMKNLLVSIFLKLPYRLFIKPFLKI